MTLFKLISADPTIAFPVRINIDTPKRVIRNGREMNVDYVGSGEVIGGHIYTTAHNFPTKDLQILIRSRNAQCVSKIYVDKETRPENMYTCALKMRIPRGFYEISTGSKIMFNRISPSPAPSFFIQPPARVNPNALYATDKFSVNKKKGFRSLFTNFRYGSSGTAIKVDIQGRSVIVGIFEGKTKLTIAKRNGLKIIKNVLVVWIPINSGTYFKYAYIDSSGKIYYRQ